MSVAKLYVWENWSSQARGSREVQLRPCGTELRVPPVVIPVGDLSFRCRKQKLRAHSARWSHCTRRAFNSAMLPRIVPHASRDLRVTHDLRFFLVGKEVFQAPQVLPLTIVLFFQLLHHLTQLSPSLELESLRRGLRSISDSTERSVNLWSLIVHSSVSHICQLSSSELSSSAFMHVTHTLPSFLHL